MPADFRMQLEVVGLVEVEYQVKPRQAWMLALMLYWSQYRAQAQNVRASWMPVDGRSLGGKRKSRLQEIS